MHWKEARTRPLSSIAYNVKGLGTDRESRVHRAHVPSLSLLGTHCDTGLDPIDLPAIQVYKWSTSRNVESDLWKFVGEYRSQDLRRSDCVVKNNRDKAVYTFLF